MAVQAWCIVCIVPNRSYDEKKVSEARVYALSQTRAYSAVEKNPRSLSNTSVGNYAPADAGGEGYPVLQKISQAVSDAALAPASTARRRFKRVARTWLQPAGENFARSRPRKCKKRV